MDIANFNALFAWIAQHPDWAYATVFFAALTESLAVVGLFIPGALVMFGAGAVVAVGSLELWATLRGRPRARLPATPAATGWGVTTVPNCPIAGLSGAIRNCWKRARRSFTGMAA